MGDEYPFRAWTCTMATLGLSKVFILDKYFTELQKFWETEKKLQGAFIYKLSRSFEKSAGLTLCFTARSGSSFAAFFRRFISHSGSFDSLKTKTNTSLHDDNEYNFVKSYHNLKCSFGLLLILIHKHVFLFPVNKIVFPYCL